MSDSGDDYVEGDVNTIDAGYDDDFDEVDDGPAPAALSATAVLEFIARSLADDPNDVSIEVENRGGKVVLSLSVGPDDMGRVIARRAHQRANRLCGAAAAGARDGVVTSVDIVD